MIPQMNILICALHINMLIVARYSDCAWMISPTILIAKPPA
jgi:hypothetical protein